MSVLSIVKIGHPVLRQRTKNFRAGDLTSKPFFKFVNDMVQTMHAAQGVGLAANQVGEGIRVIVLECQRNKRYPRVEGRDNFPLEVFINPKIVKYSKEKENDWEGCLSIPGYRGLVPRSKEIMFEALTIEGKRVRETVSGFHARVLQHEVDHINGFFYLDRMKDLKNWLHLDEFNRHIGIVVKD